MGKIVGNTKVFDGFADGGRHGVGGTGYRSMHDEGEIKFSND